MRTDQRSHLLYQVISLIRLDCNPLGLKFQSSTQSYWCPRFNGQKGAFEEGCLIMHNYFWFWFSNSTGWMSNSMNDTYPVDNIFGHVDITCRFTSIDLSLSIGDLTDAFSNSYLLLQCLIHYRYLSSNLQF